MLIVPFSRGNRYPAHEGLLLVVGLPFKTGLALDSVPAAGSLGHILWKVNLLFLAKDGLFVGLLFVIDLERPNHHNRLAIGDLVGKVLQIQDLIVELPLRSDKYFSWLGTAFLSIVPVDLAASGLPVPALHFYLDQAVGVEGLPEVVVLGLFEGEMLVGGGVAE